MTIDDIWVVTVEQSFPVVDAGGETVVIAEDMSRVSFTDREKAVSFACEMLKERSVDRLIIRSMLYEDAENEKA